MATVREIFQELDQWAPFETQMDFEVYGDYMKLPPKEKQVPEHSDMEIKIYG